MRIEIYSDGGCSPNPGIGGFAFIVRLVDGDKSATAGLANFEEYTTNNRMELTGIIEAFKSIRKIGDSIKDAEIVVTSDSSYCIRPFTEGWIFKWKMSDFYKHGEAMPNRELWVELDELIKGLNIRWNWVKGHNGHYYNEICDMYAVKSYKTKKPYTLKFEQ